MSFIKQFPHAHLHLFQLSGVRDNNTSLSIEECLHLIDANFPSGDPEVKTWSRMQRFILLRQCLCSRNCFLTRERKKKIKILLIFPVDGPWCAECRRTCAFRLSEATHVTLVAWAGINNIRATMARRFGHHGITGMKWQNLTEVSYYIPKLINALKNEWTYLRRSIIMSHNRLWRNARIWTV